MIKKKRKEGSSLKLYLVQHGEALPGEVDPDRPLTPQGIISLRRIARVLSSAGISVDQIWHSGKRRAIESSVIIQEELMPSGGITKMSGLDPKAEVGPFLNELDRIEKDLMIVGHLPFLGKAASCLLTGIEDKPLVIFQKGCVLCLEKVEDHWEIVFHITPDLLQ